MVRPWKPGRPSSKRSHSPLCVHPLLLFSRLLTIFLQARLSPLTAQALADDEVILRESFFLARKAFHTAFNPDHDSNATYPPGYDVINNFTRLIQEKRGPKKEAVVEAPPKKDTPPPPKKEKEVRHFLTLPSLVLNPVQPKKSKRKAKSVIIEASDDEEIFTVGEPAAEDEQVIEFFLLQLADSIWAVADEVLHGVGQMNIDDESSKATPSTRSSKRSAEEKAADKAERAVSCSLSLSYFILTLLYQGRRPQVQQDQAVEAG